MHFKEISNQEVVERIHKTFRSEGYDGTALTDLTFITGLSRAGLYHHFPGGKLQMTQTALNYELQWSEKYLLNVLSEHGIDPKKRLNRALLNIKKHYEGGGTSCLFRLLTTERRLDFFGGLIARGIEIWIKAFEFFGKDVGLSTRMYRSQALETVIKIQGSLLLAQIQQSNTPFLESLKQIRKMYNA